MITLEKVKDAARALKPIISNTDILPMPIKCDNQIFLKTENLQITGSFKIRGASYKISKLSPEERAKGVIACSAGNHAQGVALAAQKNNIPALICLPEGAPISKIEATRSYGAQIMLVKGVYDDAYQKALELQKEHGYTFIHPFDDDDVIAGQGTISLEILEEMPDLDAIVVPIGGGGLISGVAFAAKQIKPSIKVYGVQASNASSMYNSIKEDRAIKLASVNTLADGIAVKQPGDLTFDYTKHYVDEIFTVNEAEIYTAILTLIEKKKMVAEGAGAVALAAAMFNKLPLTNKKVCCVISGGNIDVNRLSRVITQGLLNTGRRAMITIQLKDTPGQLSEAIQCVAKLGANVISAQHERLAANGDIDTCYLKLELETRNFEHIQSIKATLHGNGFSIIV
ncbi:MAG: threonine ammonia-lyase [Clostridiales bacterium]|nr:threonine ammonia-lyase [Clostridiales bacterium]